MKPRKPIPWRRRAVVDRFNDWRATKMAVVGDEAASRAELVAAKVRLKRLILGGAARSGQSPAGTS